MKICPLSVFWILLSCCFSLTCGVLLQRNSPGRTINYRAIYFGARCLLVHSDPYVPADFLRIYTAENGEFPSDPGNRRLFLRAVPICVNLPTTLALILPLSLLPWSVSCALWLLLIAIALTLAGICTFDLSRDYAPRLSLVLICVMLANSQVLFVVGNTAGIAVSLCVIAVWCFVKARWEWFGIVGLAISLLLKPHDSGLIWLWLLLVGLPYRKRALQSAALAVVLAVPAILWVSHVAPQWRQELAQNLATTSSHGDISDPGPDSLSRKGSADVIIDLQTVLSVFRDDPHFYNPAAYMICGALLAAWVLTALRRPKSPATMWYGLASISAISVLAIYHRPYDAKLLLLAVPACSILAAEVGIIARFAVALSAAAIFCTSDIPLACLSLLMKTLNFAPLGTVPRLFAVVLARPAPVVLLILAVFYLAAYLQLTRHSAALNSESTNPSTSMAWSGNQKT